MNTEDSGSINLTGQPAEMRMTLEITRAATGLTETVELVGYGVVEEEQQKTNQTTEE